MATRKSNQRFMAWSIVAIILLLATSGYLYWNSMQLTKKLNLHKQELAAVELTQGQLEQDYELALTSLDDLKGENTDLNELIETQKLELKNQKNKISNLIWKSGKLNEAKKEIENLKNEALSFIDEINKLWGNIGANYVPSVAYKIKHLRFDANTITENIPQVLGGNSNDDQDQ